jgi:hypothetical protein
MLVQTTMLNKNSALSVLQVLRMCYLDLLLVHAVHCTEEEIVQCFVLEVPILCYLNLQLVQSTVL